MMLGFALELLTWGQLAHFLSQLKNTNIWSPTDVLCLPNGKEMISLFFYGRFIWTVRDKKSFQESYKLICILMNEISICSPINQKYVWIPGVVYTSNKLRLGALS